MPAILRNSLPNLFASLLYSQSYASIEVGEGSRPPGLIVRLLPIVSPCTHGSARGLTHLTQLTHTAHSLICDHSHPTLQQSWVRTLANY